jgi:hypothetical protein
MYEMLNVLSSLFSSAISKTSAEMGDRINALNNENAEVSRMQGNINTLKSEIRRQQLAQFMVSVQDQCRSLINQLPQN